MPHLKSQRDVIRYYMQNAIENKIAEFELVDDSFNYDTLAQNASATISKWLYVDIYQPMSNRAKKRLITKLEKDNPDFSDDRQYFIDICYRAFNATAGFWRNIRKRAFSIMRKRGDDRVHVYCTLNHDFINHLEQDIYDDMMQYIKRKQPGLLKQ